MNVRNKLGLALAGAALATTGGLSACGSNTSTTASDTVSVGSVRTTEHTNGAGNANPATWGSPDNTNAQCGSYGYLKQLDCYDVYYSSDTAAVSVAKTICSNYDMGYNDAAIARSLEAGGTYDQTDAYHILDAATSFFCPEWSGNVR